MHATRLKWFGGILLLGLSGAVSASPTGRIGDILRSAESSFTVHFGGLPVGGRVSTLSVDQGMSGSGVGATLLGALGGDVVHVSGQRADRGGDSNRAMIFDGECGGDPTGCSGNDDDLYEPGQGNLLIVSQDNDAESPNDNHDGGHLDFDFSDFGPGSVTVTSLEVFDVSHHGAAVYLYADGEMIQEVPIPRGGTGERRSLELGTAGVDFMRVEVEDSFAIDNLVFEVEGTE